MFSQWMFITPSLQAIEIVWKRCCCLSECLYCLGKLTLTFGAYFLVAFSDWILIQPSSPSAPFTHLTKAPSHCQSKGGEESWKEGLQGKYRENEGYCIGWGGEVDIGMWWRKKDTARVGPKHYKLQKMAGLFRFKTHSRSWDYWVEMSARGEKASISKKQAGGEKKRRK